MKNQQDLITIIACSHIKSYGILLPNSNSSCPTNLPNCKVPTAKTETTQQVGSKNHVFIHVSYVSYLAAVLLAQGKTCLGVSKL